MVLGVTMTADSVAATPDLDVLHFARAPAFASPALSPYGAWLAYVRQHDGRQTVVLRALSDGNERRTLTVEPAKERVRWCDWAGPDYLLCGTVLPERRPERVAETTRLYAIDTASGRVRNLNSRIPDALRDQVIDLSPARPGRVLLQHDPVGRGYPEVSELVVASGRLQRVVRAQPPIRRWMSDGRGEVRLGIGYDAQTATLFKRENGEEQWQPWLQQSLADPEAIGPLAFGSDTDDLYVLSHHQGRAALFHTSLRSSEPPSLLFAHSTYDVAGPVILDPRSHALLAVQYAAHRVERHFFDTQEAVLQSWLDAQFPGAVNLVIDRTFDGRYRLVRSSSDIEPPTLFLLDAETRRVSLIGHDYPELEDRQLARTRAVSYKARDGQSIPAYLTLPSLSDEGPVPAIVLPHGGPETRSLQEFDPLVQFLTAQGYAVLQMNFRGSFGYGARFAAAGVGQWGGVIHNDITDGTRWLIEAQIADPGRLCIVGMSFGGYAALLGAARESEWYACAASFAGVSDLLAFSEYTQRLVDADVWSERLGADSRGLWQMSPLARVRAVETPVLLLHGRSDAVVPVNQSRRFARELRLAGKQHRLVERADCDHEMTIESCRAAFYEELEGFLAGKIGHGP